MKEIFKKTIIIIMTIFTIFSGLALPNSNYVYADDVVQDNIKTKEESIMEEAYEWEGRILDGIVGILSWIPRVIIFAMASALRAIIWGITAIGGAGVWDIEGIIFTDADGHTGTDIVSIDFFNITSGGNAETIQQLRKGIATWYYSLRNLAIVILLGILLYIGIRMAISTVADEEAKYKKMFKDWAVSFALLFIMHYFMIAIIELNKVLVTIMYKSMTDKNNGYWESYMTLLTSDVFHWSFTVGIGALIIYIIMIGVTLLYLITYIKRMLTIAFLIMIAPLITITYSVDKIRDNRSQALDTWIKEFTFNVLIQPFHCIIYLVFIQSALNLMHNSQSMSSAVLAVIMIVFMHKAEDIVKQIFNFQSASLGKAVANTALITTGMSLMKKRGDKDSKKNVNINNMPDMSPQSSGGTGKTTPSKNAEQNMNAVNQENQQRGGSNSNDVSRNNTGGSDFVDNPEGANSVNGENNLNSEDKKNARKEKAKVALQNATAAILKGSARAGTYAILGGLALATGQGSALISAYEAGKAINSGVEGRINKNRANNIVKNNEENFAGIYKSFQQNSNRSTASMNAFTDDIINGRAKDSEMDDNERLYASYVRKMGKTYAITGEQDVSTRMSETLEMINNNEIKEDKEQNYNIFTPYQQQVAEPNVETSASESEPSNSEVREEILKNTEGNTFEEQVRNAKTEGETKNNEASENKHKQKKSRTTSTTRRETTQMFNDNNTENQSNNGTGKRKNSTKNTGNPSPSIFFGNEGNLQEELRNRNKK